MIDTTERALDRRGGRSTQDYIGNGAVFVASKQYTIANDSSLKRDPRSDQHFKH
jgi:hypothetical protein